MRQQMVWAIALAIAWFGIGCADSNEDSGGPTARVIPPAGAAGAMGNVPTGPAVSGASGRSAAPPFNSGTGSGVSGAPSMPLPMGGAPTVGGAGAGVAGMVAAASGAGGTMSEPTPRMGETCLQAGNGMYTERGPY